MSGELQTIPARYGVATFVPKGRTIKVINTYGKQVVSMWAFGLGAPPEEEDEEEPKEIDEEKIQEEAEGLKNAVETHDAKESESTSNDAANQSKEDDNDDPPEQAPDTPENEKSTESTASPPAKQPTKRTWGSYLPSIPYRNKGAEKKPVAKDEKAQNEANTKKWSSYLPTGKSFSSYVPNVQMPDAKAVSAFTSSHYRDPNKSYAEQLYDFSKTPVGAGTIAGKRQITISWKLWAYGKREADQMGFYSCHRLGLCFIGIRRILCLRIYTPFQFIPTTHGVPLTPPYTRILTQACARGRRWSFDKSPQPHHHTRRRHITRSS
jgi:hypothetical protein